MYFQRALVVSAAAAVHGPTFRTAFFAALNTWSAAAILLMQVSLPLVSDFCTGIVFHGITGADK
jgi:hypothetical protein